MTRHDDHRKTYYAVWLLLLVFTVITVWVAYHDFGAFNILVAMLIATIKAALVCLYFMHLKYDNRLNQVVFVSSFVFLAIFVGLTASDELFRPLEAKAKIEPIVAAEGNQSAQHELLRKPTPELLAYGKEIYTIQCQTCHGAMGKGDGPAAGALNPRPRDFTSGEWKQGGAPSQVFATVGKGIAGTGMASFESLPVKDRWAVVHFVRSLSPNAPEDTPETLAASGLMPKAGDVERPSVKIPVEFAIERLVEEAKK